MLKKPLLLFVIGLGMLSLNACKTKKVVAQPVATKPVETQKPVQETPPKPEPVAEKPAPVEEQAAPNYNFSNVQFEFNSGVLKTESYAVLDKIATEIKKDPSATFILHGHSSAEGTPEHNMSLSVDRANSVKSYLVNAGINATNLSIKGHGEAQPMTANTTEEGRVLNRRVEVKKN